MSLRLMRIFGFVRNLLGVENDSNKMQCEDVLPPDIWREILLRTEEETLRSAVKVCRTFREILSDDSFWSLGATLSNLAKLIFRKTLSRPDSSSIPPESTCSTLEQLQREYDIRFSQGGNGFAIETPPHGCVNDHPDVETCFATTFNYCHYNLRVDLTKWGIEEWVLDYIRPTIRITELVAPRNDCGCSYEIYARLSEENRAHFGSVNYLDPQFHSYCKLEKREWPQWSGCGWEEVALEISEYPIGMRFLSITSGGKDSQFWSGHYGPKMARLKIEIVLPSEGPRLLSPELWADNQEPHFLADEPFIRNFNPEHRRLHQTLRRFHRGGH
ncbi:unnamed protein product [Caenorhabditis auriculariae]|uniref:FBA domain-containing protein n=1 Tax=Caenorhabditis auriculariae TaxID=2777116 RepID=A0A8S1GVR2_9PELO|nr:unnamed protein product [Caenorhabditis auriculariae]